jgi:hypothetical protein
MATHLEHADVVLPVDLIPRWMPQLALLQVAQQLRPALEEVKAVLTEVQLLGGEGAAGQQGSRTAGQQRSRTAEQQGSRAAGQQGSRAAGQTRQQGSRAAGQQDRRGSRAAGQQDRRGNR